MDLSLESPCCPLCRCPPISSAAENGRTEGKGLSLDPDAGHVTTP